AFSGNTGDAGNSQQRPHTCKLGRGYCLNICFICSEYPPGTHGGIGTMTQMLARALVERGHHVRVVGVYQSSYPGPDYQEDEGVRGWRLGEWGSRHGWLAARYRLFREVVRWSHKRAIDVVEVPDWHGWAAGWPRLSVPVIARLNGSATYFAAELSQPVRRT